MFAVAEITETAAGPVSAKPQQSTPLRESTIDGVKHTEITQDTTNDDDDEDGVGDVVGPDATISGEDVWLSAQGQTDNMMPGKTGEGVQEASPSNVGKDAAVAGHLAN
jgi:hypothetical protein